MRIQRIFIIIALAGVWFGAVLPGRAEGNSSDARLAELEQKLRVLEQKLELVQKEAVAKDENSVPAKNDSASQLAEIDQKQRVLDRKWELSQEEAEAKAKNSASVKADSSGFALVSNDKAFELKLRGYAQADARFFQSDDKSPQTDTFLLRRVSPILEGTLGKSGEFRIMPDFAGTSTTLQDAYLGYKFSSAVRLRAGKFKAPFGLERLQSSTDNRFVELAHPTSLTPNRDIGAQVFGDLSDGVVSYALGIFNGVPDGGSSVTDTADGKDVVGRIFVTPWKKSDNEYIKGLSAGIAASYGNEEGTAAASSLTSYRSPGQASVFSYTTGSFADGERTRYSPQFTYYYGSFGLLGEYVVSSQEVRKGTRSDALQNEALQIAASYVLTGEENSFNGITPKNPFDLAKGQWGAFELALRYSELTLDDQTFPTYASSTKSVRGIQSLGGGINWYLTKNLKSSLTYEKSTFEGGAPTGAREDEDVLFARVQVSF